MRRISRRKLANDDYDDIFAAAHDVAHAEQAVADAEHASVVAAAPAQPVTGQDDDSLTVRVFNISTNPPPRPGAGRI